MTDTNNAPFVETKGLTKAYGKKLALDSLNFKVDRSGIIGLLGRNGAGKSTLIRILTGQDFGTSGECTVFGEKPFDNDKVLSRVCVTLDYPEIGWLSNVKQFLVTCRDIYPKWDDEYAMRLVSRFELNINKKLKALSRGMQTSLVLVAGLASKADLTFFDEPSLGLDAVMRERFYDMLIDERQASPNRCMIVSTHLIEEASRALDYVFIIESGSLMATGTPTELTADAYTLTGVDVEPPSGAKLLRREVINGITTLYLTGSRPVDDVPGVVVAPMSLQRLFVMLTDTEGVVR